MKREFNRQSFLDLNSFLRGFIPYKTKMINLQASLIGFHNPKKHKGLTPEEFLMIYLKRQAHLARYSQKLQDERAINIVLLLSDWDKWVLRVKKLFRHTFLND